MRSSGEGVEVNGDRGPDLSGAAAKGVQLAACFDSALYGASDRD